MSIADPPTRPCRLCGAATLPHLEVRGWSIDRCGACTFVQVRERPSEEELREIYSAGYFASSKYEDEDNQDRENQRRLRLLDRAGVPRGARVLDAGCATGDFITAARRDYEMWGLDISAAATAAARVANPSCADRIYTGLVEDHGFEPASFDAIVLWDVIEHVWDPRAVLASLAVLLRPGGVLALSTPDIGALTAKVMKAKWAFMTPPEHLGFFSLDSMGRLLRELHLAPEYGASKGKWVNAGFFTYKLGRVFPGLVPDHLVRAVHATPLARLPLYVPTMDIQYVTARKI